MSSLLDLLKKLSTKTTYQKRYIRHSDPAKGIEYNKINPAYLVTKKIWKVDIARTPQVVRGFDYGIDMHKSGHKANRLNAMVNYCHRRVKGR